MGINILTIDNRLTVFPTQSYSSTGALKCIVYGSGEGTRWLNGEFLRASLPSSSPLNCFDKRLAATQMEVRVSTQSQGLGMTLSHSAVISKIKNLSKKALEAFHVVLPSARFRLVQSRMMMLAHRENVGSEEISVGVVHMVGIYLCGAQASSVEKLSSCSWLPNGFFLFWNTYTGRYLGDGAAFIFRTLVIYLPDQAP